MNQISKTLGQNIKQIRLRRKMSQGDICRRNRNGQKLYECD